MPGGFTDSGISGRDREGKDTWTDITSPPLSFVDFCGAVSVLNLNNRGGPTLWSPTLGAVVTHFRVGRLGQSGGADGSAIINSPSDSWDVPKLVRPALVRQFSRAVDPQVAPGISGTYGATWAGRTVLPGLPPR